jgi:RAB protein geranylgeranyltransferase component A
MPGIVALVQALKRGFGALLDVFLMSDDHESFAIGHLLWALATEDESEKNEMIALLRRWLIAERGADPSDRSRQLETIHAFSNSTSCRTTRSSRADRSVFWSACY